MRDFTSDVKSRAPYTLGHTGGPRLSRPGPVPGPVPGPLGRPVPRVARVLRAPTRCVSPRRNCSDVKSHVPYTLGDTGGPRLSRPGPAPSLLGRPAPRAARVLRAPTHRVSTRRNCSDVKSRVPCTLDHTGGPRLSRPGPVPGLLGRPAPRAARVLRAPTRCWFGDAGFHFGTAPA